MLMVAEPKSQSEFRHYGLPKESPDLAHHHYEVSEQEYVTHAIKIEAQRYVRPLEDAKEPATYPKKYGHKVPDESTLNYWRRRLIELNDGGTQRDKEELRDQYVKLVKKAISHGEPVPQTVINQRPEFKTAQDARKRYEKGLHTSFANRSVAINEQMRAERGFKVKRQDGKPITDTQIQEIEKGVESIESVLGPLYDLFDKTDLTIAHTSGKYPFLKQAGGLYSNEEKTVTMGIAGVQSLGHEVGHWLDYESGKEAGVSTRIYTKGGKSHAITAMSEKETLYDTSGIVNKARRGINDIREVRQLFRQDTTSENITSEQKEEIQKMKAYLSPYWYEPREVFARLVEQYVATKVGHRNQATDAPGWYEKTLGWWSKEEFAKLLPEVEQELQRRIKILRKSETIPPKREYAPIKEIPEGTKPLTLEEFRQFIREAEKTTQTTPQHEVFTISLKDSRSPHAIAIDHALLAEDITTKTSKSGVQRWRHKPNRVDIRGVDTPIKGHKPITRAIIDRRGRYHKQKSGTVI